MRQVPVAPLRRQNGIQIKNRELIIRGQFQAALSPDSLPGDSKTGTSSQLTSKDSKCSPDQETAEAVLAGMQIRYNRQANLRQSASKAPQLSIGDG